MATLEEIRQQYPQYNDMSDQELAGKLYERFYSDMDRADFDRRLGLAPPPSEPIPTPRAPADSDAAPPPLSQTPVGRRPVPGVGDAIPTIAPTPGGPAPMSNPEAVDPVFAQTPQNPMPLADDAKAARGFGREAVSIPGTQPTRLPPQRPSAEAASNPARMVDSGIRGVDDARAVRGFGRSAYMDGLAEPTMPAMERGLDATAQAAAAAPEAGRQLAGDVFNSPFNQGPVGRALGEEDGAQLTRNAVESGSLGIVGDEAFAAFDAMVGRGNYDERLEFYRNRQQEFAGDHPVLSFASEIAPALVPGLGGAKLVQQLTTRLGRSGAGAVLGGLAASLYGGMEGEDGAQERASNALASGGLGVLFGAAAPRITDVVANVPSRVARVFQRSQERPTLESLKAAKNVAYQAVDRAREAFSGDDMQGLSQRVAAIFDAENYVEEVDDAARATLRILDRRAGQGTTLSQLDGIRQNLWSRYTRASDQPVILDAIREIDSLIDSRSGASALMQVARAANRRYSNAQLLEDAFTRAERQTASTGSGGNILNKYRQAVTSILSNPRKARFFNSDEISLMDSFVRGSTSENLRRWVGKLSPSGNGLMMALHTIGGVASGGLSVPLMVVGSGAKNSADRAAMRGANVIQDVVAGARPARLPAPTMTLGGAAATTSAAALATQQAPAARNALARLPRGGR